MRERERKTESESERQRVRERNIGGREVWFVEIMMDV